MATRGVYTFKEGGEYRMKNLSIYKHWDNYPSMAIQFIKNGIDHFYDNNLALTRRDAMAISFLIANTEQNYSVNVKGYADMEFTSGHEAHADIEYRYEISNVFVKGAEGNPKPIINIKIFSCASWEGEEKLIFNGTHLEAYASYLLKEAN